MCFNLTLLHPIPLTWDAPLQQTGSSCLTDQNPCSKSSLWVPQNDSQPLLLQLNYSSKPLPDFFPQDVVDVPKPTFTQGEDEVQ